MNHQLLIVPSAEKDMDRLPAEIHTRLARKILSLEVNPRPAGVKKLSGRQEYRLRVGDYRVLYVVDDEIDTVTVVAVGHRREVYG